MALNVQSPTGGKWGSASSGEAQNEERFFGIREISHWALMGKLTRDSDENACALFEKYSVMYDKISGKVPIPYLETHCSVYLFKKLPAKHNRAADSLMYFF